VAGAGEPRGLAALERQQVLLDTGRRAQADLAAKPVTFTQLSANCWAIPRLLPSNIGLGSERRRDDDVWFNRPLHA
jgi:hypothetical protein